MEKFELNVRAGLMRGLSIYNALSSEGFTATTGEGVSYRAIEAGNKYTVKVNVYNFSFVDTKNVSAELHWTESAADSLDDSTRLTTLATPVSLYGWTQDGESNMKTVEFTWDTTKFLTEAKSTSDGVVSGYLHVLLKPGEDEIHTENNHGYVRMALYDPDVDAYSGTTTASGALMSTAKMENRLNVEVLPGYPKIVNALGEEVGRFDYGQKFFMAKVRVTSKYAVPDAKIALISHESNGHNKLIAGHVFGALRPGESNIETLLVPFKDEDLKQCRGLTVKVMSPFMKTASKTTMFDSGGSSTSGCNTGAGVVVLALLSLLPFAWRKEK